MQVRRLLTTLHRGGLAGDKDSVCVGRRLAESPGELVAFLAAWRYHFFRGGEHKMTPSCRTTDRPDAGRISRGALVALVCIAALAVAGGVLARVLKPPEEKTTEDGPRVPKPPVSAPAVEPTEKKASVPEGTALAPVVGGQYI